MAGNDAAQKIFEALNESSDAFIDGIRASNDRGHRFSAAVIEQAQESQRETVEFIKKWASAPFDFSGLFASMVESTTKAQGRALDGTRLMFTEMGEAQKETREVVQRMVTANRKVNEATVELARGMFSRAGEAVQSITDGNGRKARTPEPASPPTSSGL